ncbi:HU family DNA-binding protein [Qipengyuania spongiae]|uniref:HU family DNA-binding protein n=1 Tax=Qipengyuania spongiae TaxID=2909673 RepID=A0ABY5T4S2_9SPHN|nr:HU family DNA-binding protein [Qipengyuania spongiae]UVI39949.1 HU family DNA-binding protein [Qipengyuania spongiae]
MNMSELIKTVAKEADLSEAKTKDVLMSAFDAIGDAASKGDDIAIPGFGKFSVKDRPERQGRNPATGEAMTIKASRSVGFKPAKGLKDKM